MRRSIPALLFVAALAACARPAVPSRLAGLSRTQLWSGARAAGMVARLHGKSVSPESSTVADYGRPGQLRVWLSRFPDGVEAQRVLGRMVDGMSSGRTPFEQPHEQRESPGRWITVGPGGHSVLWASDRFVYWLQGEPDTVMKAADELPAPSRGQLT